MNAGSALVMTLLTEAGPFHFQKFVMVGTVGVVTVQTVFSNRRVIPKEGASLFGMAGVTVFIS